jgi:hypothetical protein
MGVAGKYYQRFSLSSIFFSSSKQVTFPLVSMGDNRARHLEEQKAIYE